MPTSKPRVWVTLEPEAYAVLVGMAKLGKTSPGRVLANLAQPVLPALARLVDAAEGFAAWEASLHRQLQEVHRDVTDGIDGAIAALEARKASPAAKEPPEPPRASGGRGGAASGGAGARASTPRSARAPAPPEAPEKAKLTPGSNTGVIWTRREQKQRVRKGGPRRAI
jgi:hypothetical protein